MVDDNFYALFPTFKERAKSFEIGAYKEKNISISDLNNNGSLIEYNVYQLYLEYQSVLYEYYNNYLKKQYNLYINFWIYFSEFLNEFKNYGIDSHSPQLTHGDFRSSYSGEFPRDINSEFGNLLGTNPQQTYERAFNNIKKEIDNIKNGYYNRVNSDIQDIEISDADSFANFVFGYSSFVNLKNSVDIYIKSISSGSIKTILDKLLESIEPTSIFRQIFFPLKRWPRGETPKSLSSILSIATNTLMPKNNESVAMNSSQYASFYQSYTLLADRSGQFKTMYWVSESTIKIIEAIISELSVGNQNFNLVYVKVNDTPLFSVSKNLLHLDELLEKNNLTNSTIFSNDFFWNKKLINISKIFTNLIEEEHSLYYPIIKKIFTDKLSILKDKYKKILKLSDSDPNIAYLNQVFDIIFDIISKEDSGVNADFRGLYNYVYKGSEYARAFGSNASIISSIKSNSIISINTPSKIDYVSLLKDSINANILSEDIRTAILNADSEIDLSIIFSNIAEKIKPIFSNKIKESYIDNQSLVGSIDGQFINTIKILSQNIPKKLLYNFVENKKKSDSSYIQDFYGTFQSLNSLKDNYFSSIDMPLKISILSSRLEGIEIFGYKELVETEKRKTEVGIDDRIDAYIKFKKENIQERINDDKYDKSSDDINNEKFAQLERNKDIYKNLSSLILDNFKREGQDIQAGSEKMCSVKIQEFSKELNKTVFVSKNVPFSNISLISKLLEEYPSDFIFSFSDFLKSIRNEILDNTQKLSGKGAYTGTSSQNSVEMKSLALFWIKALSSKDEISSPEMLQKNILSFIENFPLIHSIVNSNQTLKTILNYYSEYHGATPGISVYKDILNKFVLQSKFSKIDTLKNLSSLLKFAHNYERGGEADSDYDQELGVFEIIKNTKNLNKLYLNNYQTFLKSYIDFSSLLKNGLKGSYFGSKELSPYDLELEVYTLKEELRQDPGFGPEKAEKLLPEQRLNSIIFFQTESCDLNSDDFDHAFSLTSGNFDPKAIAILDSTISTIKQIKDIRGYVNFAKPKLDEVVEHNYAFGGSNNDKSEWRFRTLGDLDPQLFSIGVETNCCQRIGGAGSGAAIDSFINPYSSVITLEVNNGNNWTVVSQSYFHVVPKLKYFILDNIEAGKFNNETLKSMIGYNFFEAYAILAKKIKERGYKKVLCGKSHTMVLNVDSDKFATVAIDTDPRHFEVKEERIHKVYTDFENNDSYDLLKPSFSVPDPQGMVFTASNNFGKETLLKIANSWLKKDQDNKILKLANYFAKLNQIHYSNQVLLLGNLK